MNKYPTSPRLRRTGIIFLYFGAIALGETSYAMDTKSPKELGPLQLNSGQASTELPSAELGTGMTGQQLRIAARDGNIKQVETLLKQGAPIDAKDSDGWTPLICAARNGHEQICKLLIDNKATIDAKDNYGCTPLICAAYKGHEQICKLLIENKAATDAKDNYGWTPLIHAAYNGHEQICKLLIDNKASIDAKDNDGWTPLMQAASYEHEQICKVLIDALLVPVKEKQAVAIALLGIKKHRNIPGFRHIDREVIRLIVRPAYECSKRHLFDQINAIKNQARKQRLVDYAKQQLRVRKAGTSHE